MADFHEDPSVLTKEKLKSELAANNVPLPGGEHKKEVYVQLYLKNLTALKEKKSAPTDTFSSDEDLPLPVMSGSRRRGKATKKTDRPRLKEVEVTDLTDDDLKQQLEKHGVQPGPVVASTRKLYEKKLQKLLDQGPAQPSPDLTALPNRDGNPNGNTNSEQYSDKEDEGIAEPEPVPVVENSSRGKTRGTTSSRAQTKVSEDTPKDTNKSVEDILANEIATPGMSVTCRRPIRGAAGRPLDPSEYWLDDSHLQHSVHTETRSAFPRKAPAQQGFRSMLLMLLLLVAVAGSLYAYWDLDVDTLKGAMISVASNLGYGDRDAEVAGAEVAGI
uniref:Thymopoietin b n=1 Tax=Gasterosteus aculeatus aculeatus TaxID=481459 RepID=A0AAQ4P9Y3_GASAC